MKILIIIIKTIIIIIIIIILLEDQQCNARIRGLPKELLDFIQNTNKKDVTSTTEKKCPDQKVHPQSSALRWHSPSALPPKVAAGCTGGPSPPQNAALFCG